ncbi:ATP-grasp domain-containing protein [Stakelama marina]|uniref:ATP-grasp domain-containing protein n=1 Tax=Stakelama marina TaxID=2826939 RepID=A0A8T4IEF0_9SPHN|nr:ATP-grasp domain-containing protein [Stakelama marina]MBR0551375.1 ATP-grasp domain-containing protein [Stakelama marina]
MTALRQIACAPAVPEPAAVPCGRRVLVTGVGGPAGRAASAALARAGYSVIGCDMRRVPFPFGEFETALPVSDPNYAAQLGAMLSNHAVDWLVPTVAEEIASVAMLADDLRRSGVAVFVPEPAGAAICADKWHTVERLRAAGIAVPASAIGAPDCPEVAELGLPLLGKPRIGRGGRGVTVYDRLPEAAPGDATLWQQFLPGAEYIVALLPGRAEGEMPLAVAVLEKLALREGLTGNALSVRRVTAPDVARLAVSAASALALKGPLDVDIRRDREGKPYILEINPRVGARLLDAPELIAEMIALQQGGWPG